MLPGSRVLLLIPGGGQVGTRSPARKGGRSHGAASEKPAARDGHALRETPRLNLRRFIGILGPGLITGASDDDPSGIATYAQAGAQFSYTSLWTVFLCLPLMITVQEICDRTALATGKNLGELVRSRYRGWAKVVVFILLVALLMANLVNVAADLMAVGQGFALIHLGPAPLWSAVVGVAIMVLVAAGTFVAVSKVFRILCLSLLAYPIVLVMVHVNWSRVLSSSIGAHVPNASGYWKIVVAILGTTLSPYLFFWQSANRVEESDDREQEGEAGELIDEPTSQGAQRRLGRARADVISGMVFSEIVMFAIIVATASTLGSKSTTVTSAADAAKALQPLAGQWAALLFAAGFIGSGVLAVPVLAGSAATGMAGLLGEPWGFSLSPKKAPVFYCLVGLGTIGGALLSVVYSDPIGLLVFSALVNGIAAAPFMTVAMLIGRDRKLMGKYRIGKLSGTVGWIAVAVMTAAGLVGLATL